MANHKPKRTYHRRGGRGRKGKGAAHAANGLPKSDVKGLPSASASATKTSLGPDARQEPRTTDGAVAKLKRELADARVEMIGLKQELVGLKKELRMQIFSENKAAIRKCRILAEKNLRHVKQIVARKIEKESTEKGERIANISAELETATKMVERMIDKERCSLNWELRKIRSTVDQSKIRILNLEGVDTSKRTSFFPAPWHTES